MANIRTCTLSILVQFKMPMQLQVCNRHLELTAAFSCGFFHVQGSKTGNSTLSMTRSRQPVQRTSQVSSSKVYVRNTSSKATGPRSRVAGSTSASKDSSSPSPNKVTGKLSGVKVILNPPGTKASSKSGSTNAAKPAKGDNAEISLKASKESGKLTASKGGVKSTPTSGKNFKVKVGDKNPPESLYSTAHSDRGVSKPRLASTSQSKAKVQLKLKQGGDSRDAAVAETSVAPVQSDQGRFESCADLRCVNGGMCVYDPAGAGPTTRGGGASVRCQCPLGARGQHCEKGRCHFCNGTLY